MGFLCHFCGKEFSTKRNYTRHWTSLHLEEGGDGNSIGGRLKCSSCEKQYKRKENLQKHIFKVHRTGEKEFLMKKCELCDKLLDKVNLKRHMILKHSPVIGEVREPNVNCTMCSAKFNSISSLNYHKKKVHKLKSNKIALTIKCPLCSFITKVRNRNLMITHFANHHKIIIDSKSCNFRSIEEFYTWKYETEKQTMSKFIRTKTKSDILMFKCHRSGKYKSMTIKRNLRITGSCKINAFCPAFIKAKIVSDDVNVTYQLTHVGHKSDLKHISLSADERKTIAVQLAQKVPFDDILKGIHCSLSNSSLQRIHLTNRKDIHNIKKSFDLEAIAIEHPFNLKTEDENILNQNIENVESTEHSFDYNTIEPSLDIKTPEENIFIVSTESADQNIEEHTSEVMDTPFDYNSIAIEHSFDLNGEEVIYDIKPEHTVVLKSDDVNVAINHMYNVQTVEHDFDIKTIEYPDSLNVIIDQDDKATNEAVQQILEKPELKKFLDPESLDKWVQNLKTSQNTSLAVYKPQGCLDPAFPELEENDFLLIYMTEAQKDILLKYSQDIVCIENTQCHDVNLYTLLTPDETRDGFPVAFMFTNRGDEYDMYIFFEKINEVVGCVIPKVFMTNIEETFYSTWIKIMGEGSLHVYCTWHVLKVWRLNVNSKIKLKDKRNQVYKTLQSLLYELDEGNFQSMLEDALMKWSQDEATSGFHKFFTRLYVVDYQFKKWAYCYRVSAGINTTISIDSFNRILKYCNLRGEKIKETNKTLCDVLNLLRVKLFELIIKINKGKVAKKLQNLRLRHGYSYANDSEYVIQEEDKWQVLNYVNNEVSEVYIVKKLKECNICLLQCHHCNSCFHEYVCSCSDHLIKNNMCKHIHLVARTQKLMEHNSNGIENSMDISASDAANTTLNEIGVEQISDNELPFVVKKRQFIEEVRKLFEEKIETVEQLEYVKQQCQPILCMFQKEKKIVVSKI